MTGDELARNATVRGGQATIIFGNGVTIGVVAVLFPITGVLFVIGYFLFSVDVLRSKILGRGEPMLMMIGIVVFSAGLSGLFPMFVV